MNAGTLEIQLAADVARLRADMGNALGIVQRTAKGFDNAAAQMRDALGGIGGGLSAAAFGTWIKSAIDFQDQLNDLNKTTDIAVSKLAGISLMSKQTGSDLTGMAQAMNKLTMEMGKAPEKFAKIGITAKTPLEAFGQLSDIFRSIEDPQLRAAVAAEALGKGWASAAPALSEGSKAIGDMVTRGEELAGITELDAQMADAFNDSMSELQLALMGTASNLAGDMLPLLTELVKSLTEVTDEANKADGSFNYLTETLRAVIVLGGNVAFVVSTTAKEIGILANQLIDLGTGNWSQAFAVGREWQADAAERRAAFDAWEQRMMTAGKSASSLGNETDALSRRMASNAKATLSAAEAARLKAFVDATAGKKAADELKKQREEEEKFRIAWGRADSTRQGDAVMKRNEEEAKALAAAIDGLTDSRNRQFDADAKVIKSAEDMVAQAQFELSIMGLSNVEREKAIALRQLEATGIDKQSLKFAELAEAMNEVIGNRAAMQKQIDDFQNVWSSIDRTAQQTFTNIFDGGQDAFTKLRDTLKSTLLDLLYQMTVRKWVFNLAANVTGASSGAVGAVANSSGLNSIGGLMGNFSGMSMANTAGSMFANVTGGGLDALLATNGAFGTAPGGAGIMGTLGEVLPWVGGALAIASLLDNNKGGPKTIGGASDAATIQATVAATLAQFGVKSTGLRVGGFSAADPQGDSLTQLQTALFQGDRALYSRQDRLGGFENVGRSSEELAAAWAEEQSRIMLAALQATLEPKYQQYMAGISADASSLDEVNAALARLTTARTLEERLLELSSTEAENLARARARELDAMDAALRPLQQRLYALQDEARITGKITAVMGDYLSDTELRAARIWQIHQQIGRAGLDVSLSTIASATRADFRALYEEMVRIGNMGAAEALLDVAGAFAQITEPANQAADAVEDMARRLQDAGKGVWDYVRTLTATRAGTATPVDMLGGTRSNYLQDLALARAGDLDAYGRINSSAQAYIDAQKSYTASGGDTQAVISQIISELNSLPAVQSYEQQNLALLGQIVQATGTTSTATSGSKLTGEQILSRLMQDSLLSYSRAEAASVYNAIASNTNTSASYLSNIAYHSQLMANQLISGVMNVRSEYRAGGLATFEAGGFHTGGLRLVGERGPELEVTGPARIYNAQQTRSMLQGSGGASAEEIRGLREDVRRLTAVVAAGANANLGKQDAIVTNTRRTAERAELMAARP